MKRVTEKCTCTCVTGINLYVSEGLAQELFCGALEISEKDVEEWCLMQCSSFFYAGQREARQPVNR